MSRNRNLRNKIVFPTFATLQSENLSTILASQEKNDDHERVYRTKSNRCFSFSNTYFNILSNLCSSNDTLKTVVSDYESFSADKSSTSSSWEDDYEHETTEKVSNELRRLERVLRGIEEIPSNYDDDEYELWMKTFPKDSFIGISTSIKKVVDDDEKKKICSIKNIKNEKNVSPSSKRKQTKYGNGSHRTDCYNKTKSKKHEIISIENLLSHFDELLQVSPIPIVETNKIHENKSNNTRKGIKSISRNENNSEFSPLPVLSKCQNSAINAKRLSNQNSSKKRNLILPPITVSKESQSESPRQSRKGMSAYSNIFDTKKCELEEHAGEIKGRNSLIYSEYSNRHLKKIIM